MYSGLTYLIMGINKTNPFHARAASLVGKGNYMALGSGKQILAQLLGDGSYYTGVGLSNLPEDWDASKELADPTAFREQVSCDEFRDFAEEQRNLIKHSEGDIYPWPLYDMPVESLSWPSVPGVTVIGDAAHVRYVSPRLKNERQLTFLVAYHLERESTLPCSTVSNWLDRSKNMG